MPYYSGSDVVKRVPVKVTARQPCPASVCTCLPVYIRSKTADSGITVTSVITGSTV